MTVVVPLSAFFIFISVLDLSSLSAICSLKDRLFRGSGLRGHIYTSSLLCIESENIVLIYAWMVFQTIHMSLHYDCYDTYL